MREGAIFAPYFLSMTRFCRYIFCFVTPLLWAAALVAAPLPAANSVAGAPAAHTCGTADPAENPGCIDTHSRELFSLVLHTLQSDGAPGTHAQTGSRNTLPSLRLTPAHKILSNPFCALSDNLRRDAVRHARQLTLRAQLCAALDDAGYYVFALRKIII